MISNLISLFISSRLQREPIYEALAIQDGIHLPSAESRRHPQRQIMRIMRKPGESLAADLTVKDALDRVHNSGLRSWLVTDGPRVLGVLNLEALQGEMTNGGAKAVGDLVDSIHFPHLHADHSLDLALERMGANHVQILPVVNRADVHDLLGVVILEDVLHAYGLGNSDPGQVGYGST
jgi:CIC family chloride channel protein